VADERFVGNVALAMMRLPCCSIFRWSSDADLKDAAGASGLFPGTGARVEILIRQADL
jgi:hypothetical protein